MKKFGKARLYRPNIGRIHKCYFSVFGIADPSHYLRSQYFQKYTNNVVPRTILDAGCGNGDYSFYMAERWPQSFIDAIDINEESIEKNTRVQKKWGVHNIKFQTRNLTNVIDENKYDLIVCIDVLEHITEQEKILEYYNLALSKNGYLYLHIPLARSKPVPFSKYLRAFHEWTEKEHIGTERTYEEIVEMLRNTNFEIVKSQYTFYYHYGEMACSLFAMFFRDTLINRVAQAILSPFARLMCYGELLTKRKEGFAMAVLAQKR